MNGLARILFVFALLVSTNMAATALSQQDSSATCEITTLLEAVTSAWNTRDANAMTAAHDENIV